MGQVLVANLGLRFDYAFPRKTDITLEGLEHLQTCRPVFIAMNHTDRYNYWPFQYAMFRRGMRFTATWVKGKYYETGWMGWFMDQTNNIPLPSRGYVISTEFRRVVGRPPTKDEYRLLRDLVDRRGQGVPPEGSDGDGVRRLYAGSTPEVFLAGFDQLFDQMMGEVVRLTHDALTLHDCHVLVFPQGTRSKRLARGLTGLMQVAQHLGVDIVPVGCNGSDGCYPGGSPFSKGGPIVYRIGAPLRLDGPELGPHRVTSPFAPFSHAATRDHGAAFQAATEVVMNHIDGLLDPDYRFGESRASDGVREMERFL